MAQILEQFQVRMTVLAQSTCLTHEKTLSEKQRFERLLQVTLSI